MDLFKTKCPSCQCIEYKRHTSYKTQNYGERIIHRCIRCERYFSSSSNTFMAGLKKPLSTIITLIEARTEGVGLNATSRIFKISKNTILNWENRFSPIKEVLQIYALLQRYISLIIEGDEVYTRVGKNSPPDESIGWTIVLMDRASRFLWELHSGRKNRKLFMKALKIVEQIVNQTKDLSLLTDGERRYGNILFEICHELIRTGKRGRPCKTLRKGVRVRLKNKGSQAHKKGPKRPKYQSPVPEHPDTINNIQEKDIHANHCEAFNSSLRRRVSTFRRKTNTYAKIGKGLQRILNVYWVVHNFIRPHFTTRKVPAVSLGILTQGFSWEAILMLPVAT